MKRQQQDREMMDNLPPTPLDYTKKKPLTYLNPHDTEAKSPPEPLDRYFGEDLRNEQQAARGRDISPTRLKDGHHPTTYDTSYQPPRRDFSPAPSTVLTEDLPLDEKAKLKPTTYVNHYHFSKNPRNCGGYVFLRFSDSDFMEVCVAVTRLKGMLMSHNGKVVGIARKNEIRILKNNGTSWDTTKYKSHRDPGYQTRREEPVTDTNKAMLVFWFASYEDALNLMNASHGNPFFQRDFPRPDGYQAFYVPLREPDIDAGFPTFLLTEYPNPSKDPVVTKIEADSRQIIERELPGECQPYLVSTEGGIRILRGDWMSPKSRILVSRFPTSSKVLDLYKKDSFLQNKQSLTHYLGNETTVLFTLTELYCSDPYGQ
ncbi:hypothetical protein ACJMK2_009253 [Sinanodonta woodiana]|uniref:Uncharacterized protein n=1 Tax=Sinanodonta woodiana TaxID=1069815 RepID=A0ABD3VEL2_SINWO